MTGILMKILIVKLSAFGDIIHALPALDDLLQRPEVDEVHWLVDTRYRFVTDIFPESVCIHAINMKHGNPVAAILNASRELRRQHFDYVLDLQGLVKSSLMARLAAPRVYGIDADFCRERVSSWLTQPVLFHPEEKHVVQQYRRVASAPFAPSIGRPDTRIEYKAPQVSLNEAMQYKGQEICYSLGLSSGAFVILHVGGGWQTKQLPDATWQTIASGIVEQGCIPVFSWGAQDEAAHAHNLTRKVQGAISLARRLDITPLCGMLAAARAVVGADTGIIHLAAALGTTTISFWGPSASWRSAPLEPQQFQVESHPDCGPCFKRSCDNFICMERIPANDILDRLNDCR